MTWSSCSTYWTGWWAGKSVILIEHHQAVMAHADWIIDLGPGEATTAAGSCSRAPRRDFDETPYP